MESKRNKPISPLPEWFDNMNVNSNLNTQELSEIFDYKNRCSISKLLERGQFPYPDEKMKRVGKTTMPYWKKSTIVKFLKDEFGVE